MGNHNHDTPYICLSMSRKTADTIFKGISVEQAWEYNPKLSNCVIFVTVYDIGCWLIG